MQRKRLLLFVFKEGDWGRKKRSRFGPKGGQSLGKDWAVETDQGGQIKKKWSM